jgi:hypothetical protein
VSPVGPRSVIASQQQQQQGDGEVAKPTSASERILRARRNSANSATKSNSREGSPLTKTPPDTVAALIGCRLSSGLEVVETLCTALHQGDALMEANTIPLTSQDHLRSILEELVKNKVSTVDLGVLRAQGVITATVDIRGP